MQERKKQTEQIEAKDGIAREASAVGMESKHQDEIADGTTESSQEKDRREEKDVQRHLTRKKTKQAKSRKKKSKSSKKKKKKKSKSKKKSRDSSDSESDDSNVDSSDDEGQAEKNAETIAVTDNQQVSNSSMTESEQILQGLDEDERREAQAFKAAVQGNRDFSLLDDSDDEIGPKPLIEQVEKVKELSQATNYGGALMPGEGAAIAQFVQKNMRIPRRGEVGWTGTEIESLENAGFVMSGSRHTRMNAIRIRKENQVYSAEEKRALTLINFEEKQQRENKLLGDFRQMLTQRMKDAAKEKELLEKANAQ